MAGSDGQPQLDATNGLGLTKVKVVDAKTGSVDADKVNVVDYSTAADSNDLGAQSNGCSGAPLKNKLQSHIYRRNQQ